MTSYSALRYIATTCVLKVINLVIGTLSEYRYSDFHVCYCLMMDRDKQVFLSFRNDLPSYSPRPDDGPFTFALSQHHTSPKIAWLSVPALWRSH
jgi:hypothetical protein